MSERGLVTVTGASGFLGGYLVPALLQRGTPVRAFVRKKSRATGLKEAGATIVEGNLTEPESLAPAMRGASAVIHLAAVADSSNEDLNEQVNVQGSRWLAEACVEVGVRRVINVSSTCAGRQLRDAYGRTKERAERQFDRGDLDVTHLRPTMIYGKGSREFDLFARLVSSLPKVPIPGDGTRRVQPVFVDDAVDLILRVLDRPETAGTTYDVAGPEPLTIQDLIWVLATAQRTTTSALYLPGSLAVTAAKLLGRVSNKPFINVDQVLAFLQDTEVDIQPARRDLAWDPRPIEVGLAQLFGEPS